MNIEMKAGTLRLDRRQVLKLGDANGHTVCSIDGAIWVTEDEGRKDVVLEPGNCHRLSGGALVQALTQATISLA